MICFSIVSHNNFKLVNSLLQSLLNVSYIDKIIITQNIREEPYDIPNSLIPKVVIKYNRRIKGFGENHNVAFKLCESTTFCILNPDVIFNQNCTSELLNSLFKNNLSMIAPIITNSSNVIEDSFRSFVTPVNLLCRKLFMNRSTYTSNEDLIYPDWIAGMFMLFKSSDFRALGGFNTNYFMYCEDMDICYRMNILGMNYAVLSHVSVIHNARRNSRKNLIYFYWHIKSLFRFWFYYYFNSYFIIKK